MTLHELQHEVMNLAREKGWGTTPEEVNVPEKFALLHSEVTEAFIAYRKQWLSGKDGLPEEFADIIMRTLHLVGVLNIDIEAAVVSKLKRNQERTWPSKT